MPPYRNTRSSSNSHPPSKSLSHLPLRSSNNKNKYRNHPLSTPRQPSTQPRRLEPAQIPLISHRSSIPITSDSTIQQPSTPLPIDYSNSTFSFSSLCSPPRYTKDSISLQDPRTDSDDRGLRSSISSSSCSQRPLAIPRLTINQHIENTSYTLLSPTRLPLFACPLFGQQFRPTTTAEMVFQSHVLSAKVQVDFENDGVIDMLGGPNTGTSYSLPGHIIISLPALPAPLEGRLREVKDLKLVMEGKSEFWDDHGRYTPMRLHTTTLTLATPSNPLLLPSHDPARPGAQRIKLAVAFDLRLPGWLPPSHDSEMTTISYGAIAHCTIGWTEPASTTYAAPSMASSSSSSPSMHSEISMESILPMRSTIMKTKSAKPFDSIFGNHSLLAKSTEKTCSVWSPFSLQRHRLPSAIGTTAQDRTERHFTLRPEADSTSPVECVVTVPDWVDVNGEEKSLKVSLRVRARRNAIEPQSMLVDSTNQSTVSSDLSASTATSSSASGSGSPLTEGGSRELESVPMERQGAGSLGKKAEDEMLTHILELGMEVEETERYSSTPSQSFTSSFPLPAEQPTRNSSQHQLISPRCNYADGGFLGYDDRPFKGMRTRQCLLTDDGNQRNFFFADKGLGLGEKWRKVNIVLPMPSLDSGKGLNTRPQPEMDGPFLRVRHDLKIRVVCKNGNSDDTQVVILSTPIKFGTRPSTMPSNKEKPAPLPAYIQLFHENGEQREGDPLPLYSKSDAISPTASSRAVPESPTPSYASLYPLTARPCSSRSPSPSSYSESSSSSSLGRRDRSSSPSPSSEDEPMDIDDQVISSDDDSVRNAQLTPNTNMNANSRKAARTLPRAVRAMA